MKEKLFLTVQLQLYRNDKHEIVDYNYKKKSHDERPMALDILLQAQEKAYDDLAFRYGCRARNCGVCTVNVNDKPRLACRARVKNNDLIAPLSTLPIVKDMVVKRDAIPRQMQGYNNIPSKNNLNVEADDKYHNLTSCIECYACLDGCPMHAKNNTNEIEENQTYEFGNPFSLLKLQRLMIDPLTPESEKNTILSKAKNLGLDTCINCPGCKCGVGIDLKGEVIAPLLLKAFNK